MAKLVAYYSRADENYFGGQLRYIEVGNTEKAAKMIAEQTGADLFKIEQKTPYAKDYNTCIAQAKDTNTVAAMLYSCGINPTANKITISSSRIPCLQ